MQNLLITITKIPVWWAIPDSGMHPDLAICDPDKEGLVRERLGTGYTKRQIPLRAWWVEDAEGVNAVKVLRWFFTRQAWSPIGATDVLVFEATKK